MRVFTKVPVKFNVEVNFLIRVLLKFHPKHNFTASMTNLDLATKRITVHDPLMLEDFDLIFVSMLHTCQVRQ